MAKLPSKIQSALKSTGLPYKVKMGRGHNKLYLAGNLVGVVGVHASNDATRATLNVVSQIRRMAREIHNV